MEIRCGEITRATGPWKKLLARSDDQLVVMATGDEMTVEFDPHHLPGIKARLEARLLPPCARLCQRWRTQHCFCVDGRTVTI